MTYLLWFWMGHTLPCVSPDLRDNYDKEVKSSKSDNKRRHFNPQNRSPKKPDNAVYIPPSRQSVTQEVDNQESSEEDDMPKTLFCFEFEDKDGKIYKQYVKEGVRAELLAQRMGYDRRLAPGMIKALEQRLNEEINRRSKKKGS